MADDPVLDQLARLAGLQRSYARQSGEMAEAPVEAMRAVLDALGLDASTPEHARESLGLLESRRRGPLAPLITAEAGLEAQIDYAAHTDAQSVEWRIESEDGQRREGRADLTQTGGRRIFALPAQPQGYHRLEIDGACATLICAPPQCFLHDALAGEGRAWGAAAQIYSLSSAGDLGVGGFSEAARLAQGLGDFGASFLGLSPVHAMFPEDRSRHSPYSPSSRLFIDPLFIDPLRVRGFTGSDAARTMSQPDFVRRLAAVRAARLIDYKETWAIKRALLDPLWRDFKTGPASSDFEAFRARGGQTLENHALFHALAERLCERGLRGSGEWPAELGDPGAKGSRSARGELREEISFHCWLQWLADAQFADAARAAREAGMEIGLYRDLAVGPDPAGSETWSEPHAYARALSVGAPPDALNPNGQDWGLPPIDPLHLEASGLIQFRRLLSANMRHAGALRIDHAFQLERLFLIPRGCSACDGVYVTYPFEALLAALRIESHRARCMVIAEDLGTTPPDFSEAIMKSGVLSYRLLTFERDAEGGFSPPRDYPRNALAAIATHDLPTLAGWWRGFDIDLRTCFGEVDPASGEAERAERARDRARLTRALDAEGLSHGRPDPADTPYLPVFRYLARTPSMLLALQTEDLAQDAHQANVPGPALGYPNWRRRLPMSVEEIVAPVGVLARGAVAMAEEGRGLRPQPKRLHAPPPRATYRLQFHAGFTFDDATKIVPYLASLGVSHVYASPIQTARPGSTHGYDIVDHASVNPELGGAQGFRRFSRELKAHGLKLLLDIVPNHMGVGGADNKWWLSTLEWGEASPHAGAFDIDWERLGANRKLMLPFLGKPYGQALREGELELRFDPEEGAFSVWHWEHRFPINPLDYRSLLDFAQVAGGAGVEMRPLLAIAEELRELAEAPRPVAREGRVERCERIKRALARAVQRSARIRSAVETAVAYANGDRAAPESFGPLHRLLERQSYRLAYWRVATSEINYRRFFDINSLAGVRVEDADVFEATHALIFRLIEDGAVHGLRIDHVDGLADPRQYLERLQARVGPGFYILVEKILEPGERLRPWPIAGATGYEVLNQLDGVFVARENQAEFDAAYEAATGPRPAYERQLRATKLELLRVSFGSELESLVSDAKRMADADLVTSDFTLDMLRRAFSEIIAALPVYRTYLDERETTEEDRALIEEAVAQAKQTTSLDTTAAHDLAASLLLSPRDPERSPSLQALLDRIARRFQQLTGPVMAKSLEDTLFYRYARFVALNEVGGDPGSFGVDPAMFHAMNAERARAWPATLGATATHDMKRGEDVRARLLALSHTPDAWRRFVEAANVGADATPDANDRYLLLQTIIGAWPAPGPDCAPAEAEETFAARIEAYAIKALRESKRRSSWTAPDDAYEQAAREWLASLFEWGAFRATLSELLPAIARAGLRVSLARAALKFTIPGAPDIYQGCEFGDFTLVDPDNRRAVDFEARAQALAAPSPSSGFDEIKQALAATLLRDRAHARQLYAWGGYEALDPPGEGWIAFRRDHRGEALIAAALVNPFAQADANAIAAQLAPGPGWRNLLRDQALAEGLATFETPAIVLRKSS